MRLKRNETVQLRGTHEPATPAVRPRMKVRLTRKFADLINGIDLSRAHTGETLDLSQREAEILMAEGWAEYAGGTQPQTQAHDVPPKKFGGRRSKKR